MGQYYRVVFYNYDITNKVLIELCLISYDFKEGAKLMEHSYTNTYLLNTVEFLLCNDSLLYKDCYIKWCGDYADNELNEEINLYHLCDNDIIEKSRTTINNLKQNTINYRYIVNHSKKIYIDKHSLKNEIHPLPLLTADGNGRGGGDYKGNNSELCGSWIGDIITMETTLPENYQEFNPNFYE